MLEKLLFIKRWIGNTKIYPILGEDKTFAKIEGFNFSGSIKARAVWEILYRKISAGIITKNTTICECSSGNTAIALLKIASRIGLRVKIFMPNYLYEVKKERFAPYSPLIERTPDEEGMTGAMMRMEKICKLPAFVPLEQFTSPFNPLAQREVGREILKELPSIDYLICGVGTGGTLTGAGGYLKEVAGVRIVAIEPYASPFLSKGIHRAHGLYGLGAGFPPPLLDSSIIDEIFPVKEEESDEMREEFFSRYRLSLGRSSGAGIYACKMLSLGGWYKNKVGVVICPDFT